MGLKTNRQFFVDIDALSAYQFMAQGFRLSSEGGKDASSEIRVSGTEDS